MYSFDDYHELNNNVKLTSLIICIGNKTFDQLQLLYVRFQIVTI